jgi:hypothetical protein
MSTITLTPAQLRQIVSEVAERSVKVALQKQQPHHHKKIVTVDEYDDDVKVAKKKTPVKAAAKTKVVTCWAPLRTEGDCTRASAHKDGLCGIHHNMKLRGEEFGPKPAKELNPICIATTKKVRDFWRLRNS